MTLLTIPPVAETPWAAIVTIMGAMLVAFRIIDKLVDPYIENWRKSRGDGTNTSKTLKDCLTSIQQVQADLKSLKGEYREEMKALYQARVDDLKSWGEDYRKDARKSKAAVEGLTRAIEAGMGLDFAEFGQEESGEDGEE